MANNSPETRSRARNVAQAGEPYARKGDPVFLGFFLVLAGLAVLMLNFFPADSAPALFLHRWWMLAAGGYLLFFSLLGCVRKIYFIVGVVLIAFWLGNFIESYPGSDGKILWPILMMIFSIAIIIYGFVFKKERRVRYFITGFLCLLFSVLVFVAVLASMKISSLVVKVWPLFLVLLGISYIQRAYAAAVSGRKKNASDSPENSGERAIQ